MLASGSPARCSLRPRESRDWLQIESTLRTGASSSGLRAALVHDAVAGRNGDHSLESDSREPGRILDAAQRSVAIARVRVQKCEVAVWKCATRKSASARYWARLSADLMRIGFGSGSKLDSSRVGQLPQGYPTKKDDTMKLKTRPNSQSPRQQHPRCGVLRTRRLCRRRQDTAGACLYGGNPSCGSGRLQEDRSGEAGA